MIEEDISETEKRRARRRQKILNNQKDRLSKIVGNERAEEALRTASKEVNEDTHHFASEELLQEQSLNQGLVSTPERPLGFHAPLPDGSTLHPKLPQWVGHVVVCFLGIVLSVMNGKYFLVTFFSWEAAFLGVNGLPAEKGSNLAIALAALFGLKERPLHRLKFLMHLTHCVITDLSLFILCALIPRIWAALQANYREGSTGRSEF